ncbi:uncharacterized protein LOC115980352 [Quercus lobata]|uniref:uncharacterized protein LOC115980352 n=1 Tax=Quercus lobata TaxID=97700 RepID=UPI001243AAB6|nr:uncharacterized protein LOC115980352 [Quercus lobata]
MTQHPSEDNDVVDSSDSGGGDGEGSGLEDEDVVNPEEREFVEDSSDSWDGSDEDVTEPVQMGAGVINSNYESEELHSLEELSYDDDIGDDTDSSEDELKTLVGKGRGQKRTFLMFKPVAKAEHIRFEKDMLFTTPKQFKEAITNYAIHGGWGIRFVKNDLQKVKAVCHENCKFVAYLAKGLVQTFIDNWPQYEHRIYCRHLYNNLKKNHPGVLIRELFWKAAKATYKAEFDRLMDELKGIDEDTHSWLQDHSTTIWARHMFSEDGLSDTVLNNMCESFNNRILKFRSKPIITMLESTMLYLMTRFQDNKQKIMRVESEVCPKVLKRLHREKIASSRWFPCWAGHSQFEVKSELQNFTVDIEKRNCSCRKWNTTDIPCAHAISCIFFNRQDAEQYVHRCFHVSTYKTCYEPVIAPINGQNMWRPNGVQPFQPLIKRRSPGRPKKKRTREAGEAAGRRVGISKQCRTCGKIGHNKRSCKGEVGGNSSLPDTTNKTSAAKKTNKCRNYSNINQPTGQAQAQPSSICTTSAICIIPVHYAHLHSWCSTSAIAIISVQHAHLHSLCISSAMDKLF